MEEVIEFRIQKDYYHLLSKPNTGKDNGMVYVLKISKDDPIFEEVRTLTKHIREKYNKSFFLYSNIKRAYSKKELDNAALFQFKIKATFEPSGEESGTLYDETCACEICGTNRKQISLLTLKKGSIPKKDIARTIAGEIVVSKNLVEVFKQKGLKGATFDSVIFNKGGESGYCQLIASYELELTGNTVAGVDLFDFSEASEGSEFTFSGGFNAKFEKEVYRCPKGHTIGLNLLSEAYVFNSPFINDYDFLASTQKIGVKRGLLRPESIYFCSQAFRKMVETERLSGFEFEIANVE